jgi:membrane fusion protein, heavy metal efflux system
LQSQGATSQSAVDEANAAVQTAAADQQAAKAKLNSVGVGGATVTGRIPLRSPIDGVVVERRATLGGAVAPDTTLFRVVDARRLRIKAQWSETLGNVPAVGTRVQLIPRRGRSGVNASTLQCNGTVESQLGVVDAATRSLTLQIGADEGCTTLTPGAYLDVIIEGAATTREQAQDWTQVPLECVVDLRGIPTVFVATGEAGEFEARRVAPAPTVGGIVPIEVGLKAGEKVASKGVILLKGEALRDILGGE